MNSLELAILFHETYEKLAPDFGYETRKETKKFKEDSPNGRLMIAVCEIVLKQLQQKIAELEKKREELAQTIKRQASDQIAKYKKIAELEKEIERYQGISGRTWSEYINKMKELEQENQRLKDAIDEIIKYISKYQNFTKALEIAQKAKEQSDE